MLAASLDVLYVPSFTGDLPVPTPRAALPPEIPPGAVSWLRVGRAGAESTRSPAPGCLSLPTLWKRGAAFSPVFMREGGGGLRKPRAPAGRRFSESGAGLVPTFTSAFFLLYWKQVCSSHLFAEIRVFPTSLVGVQLKHKHQCKWGGPAWGGRVPAPRVEGLGEQSLCLPAQSIVRLPLLQRKRCMGSELPLVSRLLTRGWEPLPLPCPVTGSPGHGPKRRQSRSLAFALGLRPAGLTRSPVPLLRGERLPAPHTCEPCEKLPPPHMCEPHKKLPPHMSSVTSCHFPTHEPRKKLPPHMCAL